MKCRISKPQIRTDGEAKNVSKMLNQSSSPIKIGFDTLSAAYVIKEKNLTATFHRVLPLTSI